MANKAMMVSLATGAALASAAAAYGYYRRSGGDDFYDEDDDGRMPSSHGSSWTSKDLYGANRPPASTTPRSSSFFEREDPYMPAGTSVSEGRNSANNPLLKDKGGHT